MQFAWAGVFLFAGFLGCFQEYRSIEGGQTRTPWGSMCRREVAPRSFWLLTSLGVAGSTAALAVGILFALA